MPRVIKKPAAAKPNVRDLSEALVRIDAIYADFQRELKALRAERLNIVSRIDKKSDDKKIQEILKKIK